MKTKKPLQLTPPKHFFRFRQTCEMCLAECQGSLPLCDGCHQQLPWITHGCTSCGEPIEADQRLCTRCHEHPLPFAEVIIPLRYAYPLDRWIGAYKYQSRPGMARWLSQLLQTTLEAQLRHPPTLITGVPMHPQKQRERGYNQSLLLARQTAKALGISFAPYLLEKQRVTAHQRTLNAASRRLNLQGAFKTREGNLRRPQDTRSSITLNPVSGQTIALIDDVVTTGATGAEIAQCLLEAGATHVSLWALAKTPLQNMTPAR